jgi:hypothetical protein
MARRALAGLFLAFAAPACDWSPALGSDPAAWSPPATAALSGVDAAVAFDASGHVEGDAGGHAGGDASSQPEPTCAEAPPYDATLTTSKAGAASHAAGQPCLESCHESGGSARLSFAAAGTVHQSQTSREVVSAGLVHNVGGTTLAVDGCGNFYATADALKMDPKSSQPYVRNPAFRPMEKPLARQRRPGDCNQSGCHDFGSRLRWGIYF